MSAFGVNLMSNDLPLQILIAKYKAHVDLDHLKLDKLDFSNINQHCYADEETLLHLVARLGTPEEIDTLVIAGAQINAIDSTGFSPLHSAAFWGRLEATQKLLELGANPTLQDKEGDTPVDVARLMGYMEVAALFVQIDASLDALIAKYRYLIDFAKLDLTDINQQAYPGGDALIHIVSYIGTLEEMDLLVASGAQINAVGDIGYTPLHYAALKGRLDMAEKLLLLGADPDIRCEFNDTPAMVAKGMKHIEVENLLNSAK